MDNERYTLKYTVKELGYNLGTATDEPMITMHLQGFRFGQDNHSFADFYSRGGKIDNAIFLCLNRTTFHELTRRDWDCTPAGVETLKKDLEGKVFELDFGMRNNPG